MQDRQIRRRLAVLRHVEEVSGNVVLPCRCYGISRQCYYTFYHFGPAKIVMYLARYYDVTISPFGVWRILKRLDLNRLPASQRCRRRDRRWKRYE